MEVLSSFTGPYPVPELPGALTWIGLPQVRPPSVDLLTNSSSVPFNPSAMPMEYRLPLGAKLSQGSNPPGSVPPVHCVIPGMARFCQVLPPSNVTPAARPAAPWSIQLTTIFFGFVGLTAMEGSVATFAPRGPAGQLARGSGLDTSTSGPRVRPLNRLRSSSRSTCR